MPNKPEPTAIEQIEGWFDRRGWEVFDFQRAVWAACSAGESGLIHSPTGTGKSLAAWLGPVMQWMDEPGKSSDSPPIQVLWITPLRALAADTTENLRKPIEDLGLPWTVERRTGDTAGSTKARQRKRLPSALVTTPESLSLLLSYADHEKLFASLKCVVVDEWHELLGNKRGIQLELCLARLRNLLPDLVTWGLSATLANLEEARDVLLGGQPGRLVTGTLEKETRIEGLIPREIERFPWGGHMGTRLVPQVVEVLESAGTSLLFTNTRSQAELWHQALIRERPDWLDQIALHHGSLDRGLRDKVETLLREGRIRCVVATSSLDLGVDFSPVEQVLQVGSPKGVARLLQRAGRSGHQPGAKSAVVCVPTHAFELAEIAATRRMALANRIEARRPLRKPLDVLAQHVVTRALGGGFRADDLREEVQGAWSYRDLDDVEWQWILDFVTRGGSALAAYPEFHRVVEQDGVYTVPSRRHAQRHRMTVGTITSDAAMKVKFMKGGGLGTVEESFIARLKPGDSFLFAGRLLELVRVRELTAYVRNVSRKGRNVPRWAGGRLAISDTLGTAIRELLEEAGEGRLEEPEVKALKPLLDIQQSWSRLPRAVELLVEQTRSREGRHIYIYPFAGRLVHEGLSALVAWRLAQQRPVTFRFSVNEYGFELVWRGAQADAPDFTAADIRAALSPDNLLDDLLACLNAAELSKRQFRDIARVAGLVFTGYPGAGKTARQVQASSGLLFDVLSRYDSDNLLLAQARREVLEAQLEMSRLQTCLETLAGQAVVVETTERLTPLAFPLWAERVASQQLSSESWRDRVERMVVRLEKASDKDRATKQKPEVRK